MAESQYSFSLTTFSPSGKLVQIEYALNAVAAGATSLGIKARAVLDLSRDDAPERWHACGAILFILRGAGQERGCDSHGEKASQRAHRRVHGAENLAAHTAHRVGLLGDGARLARTDIKGTPIFLSCLASPSAAPRLWTTQTATVPGAQVDASVLPRLPRHHSSVAAGAGDRHRHAGVHAVRARATPGRLSRPRAPPACADRGAGLTPCSGVRPFGVSLLVAGFDDQGPQLFQVDPSGAYYAWKASAIGKNMTNAKTFLEKRYADEMELEARRAVASARAGRARLRAARLLRLESSDFSVSFTDTVSIMPRGRTPSTLRFLR